MSRSLREKKSSAGRIGGVQTMLRHGREHYVRMGRLGGRPRRDLTGQFNAAEINKRSIPGSTPAEVIEQAGITKLKRRWSEIKKRRVGLVASG